VTKEKDTRDVRVENSLAVRYADLQEKTGPQRSPAIPKKSPADRGSAASSETQGSWVDSTSSSVKKSRPGYQKMKERREGANPDEGEKRIDGAPRI